MIEVCQLVNLVLGYTVFSEELEYDTYIIYIYILQLYLRIFYYINLELVLVTDQEGFKFTRTALRAFTANLTWAVVKSFVTHTIPCMF